MNRLLSPFILAITGILALGYLYVAWRLGSSPEIRALLVLPFLFIWIVPAIFWAPGWESAGRFKEFIHAASYLCMGWINFLILFCLARDVLLGASSLTPGGHAVYVFLEDHGVSIVFLSSLVALALGVLAALGGPSVRQIQIPVENLDPRLDGLRIVQISDLHVGLFIGARYVRRVVRMANRLKPEIVALTGDLVDGSVAQLAKHVASLADLVPRERTYVVLGNHEYYSGASAWTRHFEAMGLKVLRNEYVDLDRNGGKLIVGGVVDPTASRFDPSLEPRPDLAAAPELGQALRILLAHHPKLAPLAEQAGFDIQLSGHTHAGQFFPWTLVVRLMHAPHVVDLSRRGHLWVYVSAGTGTWGPPVRFGTQPELTLLKLMRVA